MPRVGYDLGAALSGKVTIQAKRDLGPGTLTAELICIRHDSRTIPKLSKVGFRHERKAKTVWSHVETIGNGLVIEAGQEPVSYTHLTLPTIYSV